MDQDYHLFAAVVAAGSLSGAGRALKLSTAMVSKRLARLEDRLGARLLHRTTRSLALTAVGQTFHDDIVQVIAAAAAAEARVAGLVDKAAGPLRVSAPTSFGRLHIAPYLKRFLDEAPAIELDLELSDDFVDLMGGRVDLAIRIGGQPEPSLSSYRLAGSQRVLCAAPDYLALRGTPRTIDDLREHRLLAAANQSPWRLEGPEGMRILPVPSVVRTNSSEVVRELAIAGTGIALRSTWDVSAELRAGQLVRILPRWEGMAGIAIHAVHPRTDRVPVNIRAFIAFLRQVYQPVPPWEA